MSNGIFVWIDQAVGVALPASWEALGMARTLADARGEPLTAIIFGRDIGTVGQLAIYNGADRVLQCDDATFCDYRPEPFVALLTKLVKEGDPRIVVGPATARGRELLAMCAADLDAAMLPDVTSLTFEHGYIRALHPAYAGKVIAELRGHGTLQFATVRGRAFALPTPDPTRAGEMVLLSPVLAEEQITTKMIALDPAPTEISLADAKIVVTGGRGVGGPEGFAPLRELAETLGAALGATRATVDAGWIAYPYQIGQTGKVVSPDVYFAIGVSGAVQHQVGMRNAKVIIAVNKDPNAPVFKIAQYGIVGDLFKVVPALNNAIKARLQRG